jgi:membrane protease YdiL (CAAX protease family)
MTVRTAHSKTFNIATSIILFIVAVILWQVYDLIMLYISPPAQIVYVLYLIIPAVSIAVFFLFTKLAKSTLRKQGYKKPTIVKTSKCLLLSVVFIVIYVIIYLYPAFTGGGFNYQGIPTDPIRLLHRIASAVLVSLSVESIFRGYIFRNLLRDFSFFKSLYASSILFGLYGLLFQVPIADLIASSLNEIVITIFTNFLPFFAAGIFLGFFFYKTGWSLLGPVTFRTGIMFFLSPLPLLSAAGEVPWWLVLALEMVAYALVIIVVELLVEEPDRQKKRYGLEG